MPDSPAQGALIAIVAHWDEFGPDHGFDEIIEWARRTLAPLGGGTVPIGIESDNAPPSVVPSQRLEWIAAVLHGDAIFGPAWNDPLIRQAMELRRAADRQGGTTTEALLAQWSLGYGAGIARTDRAWIRTRKATELEVEEDKRDWGLIAALNRVEKETTADLANATARRDALKNA